MTVGFIMLCHQSLQRAAQVARHLALRDCPVVVHVDKRAAAKDRAALAEKLADLPNVRVISRQACEWGTWALVQATLDAADLMLRDFPQVQHVMLTSGSCLPLRPVQALRDYLGQRPETDFIESVTTEDVGWTVGGLDIERFTLRFPFSWRKHRRLFDRYVALQRKVGFRRKIPDGLTPHLGSQWWCLTRDTLTAILQAPDRARIDGYFRRVWIPDESYFQTLARRYARRIESRSLTLSKFDYQGRPHVFYDDHLQLLRRSDCFVARKIWPGAEGLYQAFLTDDPVLGALGEPNPGKIDRLFAKATERRLKGRTGLYMQSRFPREHRLNAKTAAPYAVLQGFDALFDDFDGWLSRLTGSRVHGRLFGPERAEFAGEERIFNGGLSDSARLRDYNPQAFLASLIWNTRGERQILQYGPQDNPAILPFIASDPQAYVAVISGAWVIPFAQQAAAEGADFQALRRQAVLLQRQEAAALEFLGQTTAKARLRLWSLAEFLERPKEHLQLVVDEISPGSARRLADMPIMTDLAPLPGYLQALRDQGMPPTLTGDLQDLSLLQPGGAGRSRARPSR
jgi:hypothetical protein